MEDDELKRMLGAWHAPEPDPALRGRIFGPPGTPWWRASVRLPLPAAACLAAALLLLAVVAITRRPEVVTRIERVEVPVPVVQERVVNKLVYVPVRPKAPARQPRPAPASGFRPVAELNPRIISGGL